MSEFFSLVFLIFIWKQTDGHFLWKVTENEQFPISAFIIF